MILVRPVKNLLQLLRRHGKIAGLGFGVGAAVWLGAGMEWPKQYSGSAYIALNASVASAAGFTGQTPRAAMAAQVLTTAGHLDWAGIVTRNHLYSGLQSDRGISQAAAALVSQVSIRPALEPEFEGEVARISYSGVNRDAVFGITSDVADGFARAVPPPLPTPVAEKAAQEPLHVHVVLPSADPDLKPASRKPVHESRSGRRHHKTRSGHANDGASLSSALEKSHAEGARLQDALNENTSSLAALQEKLNAGQAQPSAAFTNATPAPAHKVTPHQQRLQQNLARVQHELAALRARYAAEYPDVVPATQKMQDLLADLGRTTTSSSGATPAGQSQTPFSPAAVSVHASAAILRQMKAAQATQSRLQDAIARNHTETEALQAKLDAIHPVDTSAGAEAPSTTTLPPSAAGNSHPGAMQSSTAGATTLPATIDNGMPVFQIVRGPEITTRPFLFATAILWPLSLVFGFLAAWLAAWLAEQRDPSIRNGNMVRRELPPSAVFLGGIPRIRHEVIAD